MHRILLRNPEWIELTDAQRGQLISMWMLAAENGGVIVTPDRRQADATISSVSKFLKRILFLSEDVHLQVFLDLGFIEKWRQADATLTPSRRHVDATEENRVEKSRVEKNRSEDARARQTPATTALKNTNLEILMGIRAATTIG